MSLDKLAQLAEDQLAAEKFVEACEQQLKDAKEALRKVSQVALPEALEALGLEEYTTSSGIKVSVKEIIRASISKANAPLAMAWLRKHGHSKLIKTEVRVNLPSDEKAKELEADLKGKGLQVTNAPTVHPATLSAFVRQMLEEGEEIPQQLFGVFRQRESKVKVPS